MPCDCCAPCCGTLLEDLPLFATMDICSSDPTPIQLDVQAIGPAGGQWGGFFECDDCEFTISISCGESDPGSGFFRWDYQITRDAGPGACTRCEALVIGTESVTCEPLEIIFEPVTFGVGLGCNKCLCDPVLGPMRLIVTQ